MMKDFTLKKEAIKLLLRFFISCSHPLMQSTPEGKKLEACTYFYAMENLDVPLSDFLASLGLKQQPEVFPLLIQVAKGCGKSVIDEEVVYGYFGSTLHIEKIWGDLLRQKAEQSVSPLVAAQFVVLHQCLTLVVDSISFVEPEVIGKSGRMMVSGNYVVDGSKKFRIGRLAVFHEDIKQVEIGSEIVAHFGTVISPRVNSRWKNFFLSEQIKDLKFQEALSSLKGKVILNGRLADKSAETMNSYNL